MTTTTYYMHTIDGLMAFFDGEQICYIDKTLVTRTIPALVSSLEQIRAEQKATYEFRKARGYPLHDKSYDYIRVRTPKDDTKSAAGPNRGARKAGSRASKKTTLAHA